MKCTCGADVPDYMQGLGIDKCYKCQDLIWRKENRESFEKNKHLLFRTCPECGTQHSGMGYTCRICGFQKKESE